MKECFEATSFNYLSYVQRFKILNCFLAHVNISRSLAGIGVGSSVYRLDDVLLRSCQAMYAPAIALRAMKLKPLVLKYFLVDLLESLCEDDKSILEKKNESKIIKKFSNIRGKQYLLFEIDNDVIKEALLNTPELVHELLRIYDIEQKEKLREIPKELRIERNDLK